MVSVLGKYFYEFPHKQELKLKLKDMLEDQVDEKYYLSNKMVQSFMEFNERSDEKGRGFKFEPLERERERERTRSCQNLEQDPVITISMNRKKIGNQIDVANCLFARDYKGLPNKNEYGNAVCEKKNE